MVMGKVVIVSMDVLIGIDLNFGEYVLSVDDCE